MRIVYILFLNCGKSILMFMDIHFHCNCLTVTQTFAIFKEKGHV